MNKPITARISRSKTGLNFYFSPELLTAVGAQRTDRVSARVKGSAESGYAIELIFGSGTRHMTKIPSSEDGSLRIQLLELSPGKDMLYLHQMESFGMTTCAAQDISTQRVTFAVPPVSELNAPRSRKPKVAKLPAAQAAPADTPHSRLSFLLKELNILFASGEVDDVDLEITEPATNPASPHPTQVIKIGGKMSQVEIKGKVIREEILG